MRKRFKWLLLGTFIIVLTFFIIRFGEVNNKSVSLNSLANSPIANTMSLTNDDVISMVNYPVQFGRPFIEGEIPNGFYPEVLLDGVSVQTQVDVKNRYSDGSIRFAIISFILPNLSPGQTSVITFQNIDQSTYQSSSGNSGYNSGVNILNDFLDFDASIKLISPSNPSDTEIVFARDMLLADSITDYWNDGAVVTTVILADHINEAFDIGFKQMGSKVLVGASSSATTLKLDDVSWILPGQTLNLNDEMILVNSIDSVAKTISVTRNQGGVPALTVNAGNYVTEINWNKLNSNDINDYKYKSFRPIFEVEFWNTGDYKVRYVGEIANTEAFQDMYYSVDLKIGYNNPISVYSQSDISQPGGTRWTRSYWNDGSSVRKLSIDSNLDYISETGFVPKFDSQINVASSTVSNLYSSFLTKDLGIFGLGLYSTNDNMGGSGFRPELSYITLWDGLWLNHMDWQMQEIVETQADLGSAWIVHFREGDSSKIFDRDITTGNAGTISGKGRVVVQSIGGRPTLAANSMYWSSSASTDKIVPVSRATNGRLTRLGQAAGTHLSPDMGHLYNPHFVAYLLTGDYYYLEEMQFWTSYTSVSDTIPRGYKDYVSGGTISLAGDGGALLSQYGTRYQSHPATQRFRTAALSVDGTPEKEYFEDLVYVTIAAWMGMQNIPLSNEPTLPNTPFTQTMWQFGRDYYSISSPSSLPSLPSPLNFWVYGSQLIVCDNPPVKNVATFPTDPNTPTACESSWFISQGVEAWGTGYDLGYPLDSILSYVSDYYKWHFTTPGFNPFYLGAYREGAVDLSGVPFNDPLQVAAAFAPSYQSNPCFQAGGNYCDTFPYNADYYLMRHMAAGAWLYKYDSNAYNWLKGEAQASFDTGVYNLDPRYAIQPREIAIQICTPGQTQSCYSGPLGTQGVGICQPGTQTCSSAGLWGSCTGQVLPQAEVCSDNLDNNCNNLVDECAPNIPGGLVVNFN